MALRTPAAEGRSLLALAGFLLLCYAAGAIAGSVTQPQIAGWYASLEKPRFTPPNIAFPIVWGLLYGLMAVAAWRIWRVEDRPQARRRALVWFGIQLVLNAAWSFGFFGAESPLLGLLVILALDAALAVAIVAFWPLDRLASLLLVPYFAWVAYATLLNASILSLN